MSRVAWIGAGSLGLLLGFGVLLFDRWWPHQAASAWAALTAVVWLPGAVMAIGSLLAAMVVARHSPRDTAQPSEWLRAWAREWRVYFSVFAWRQPFRWSALPDPVFRTGQPCVVFVHGYLCNRGFWHPWMRAMATRGWGWRSVNLEPVFGSIDEMVELLDPVMREALSEGRPVAVIAHSMGGLVTRAWLARQPAWPAELTTCVTIGSPHLGTWVARWAHSDAGRQMREDSDWLAALRAAERADDARHYLCWRSLTDHVVYPPANALLPGATDRVVRCAGHVDLAFQAAVMTESLDWVASAFRSPAARTRS